MRKHYDNYMYIGPTILPLGLKKNTLYQGMEGMPPQLRNLIDTTPMLASLYVPTSRLGAAHKAITSKGSIENMSVKTLAKMMKGSSKTK